MSSGRWHRAKTCAAVAAGQCLVAVLLHGTAVVSAQQLSVRHYDVADGLPHNHVESIYQDAEGYLWFGTWDGLGRFDGYRFTDYATRGGLEHPLILAMVQDRQGRLWVSTYGNGVARLLDDPQEARSIGRGTSAQMTRKKFVTYPVGDSLESNSVFAMLLDAEDTLWCVSLTGLYRAAVDQTGDLKFELVIPGALSRATLADHQGRLWFGRKDELIQVVQGHIIRYAPLDEPRLGGITSIIEDRHGRLLIAYEHAVFELLEPTDGPAETSVAMASGKARSGARWKRVPLRLNPGQTITSMITDSIGALWIGTEKGLIKVQEGRQTVYTTAQGLSHNFILALREDREGNLWVGTREGGVCRLSGRMIIDFTRAEGLLDDHVVSVIEDRQGRIYASTDSGGLVEIVGGRAVPISGSQSPPFNNIGKRILQDRRGDWWIGTDEGVFRFSGPRLQLGHGKKFTAADGTPEVGVTIGPGVYEDPAGGIWVSMLDDSLYRFDPARTRRPFFERIPVGGMSPIRPVLDMMRDRSGAMWLASYGGLGRLAEGQVLVIQPTDGLLDTQARTFFQDSRGWLWIGLRWNGVSMTRNATVERPTFVNYSTADGLASGTVWSIAEDDVGRIYLATTQGLYRLDLTTGRIRHFTITDGLAGNSITHCLKDHQGNIWVATTTGLSKLDSRAQLAVKQPPPIYLSRVQVAGEDLPLPVRGARQTPALTLPASQNNLRIEYVGLSFQSERVLTYQYQLDGVDADWSRPTPDRTVNYARLSPGRYRFRVRAVNADGFVSPTPATIRFVILPPIWQRWWFLALAAVLVAGVARLIYRYRVARLLELERVRTRIATDLHDDIGSSLSQMAILSEVVKQQDSVARPESAAMLTQIAEMARALVDSMSDIVWSIDPRRDDLSNLVLRIGKFASDVLGAKEIEWDFQTPSEREKVRLTPDQRRHVFLIFKEALNNIARHADCSSVSLAIRVTDHQLVAEIRDDGCGFAEVVPGDGGSQPHEGHGLENMRVRAAQLGGLLRIDSTPGQGTALTLRVPLK